MSGAQRFSTWTIADWRRGKRPRLLETSGSSDEWRIAPLYSAYVPAGLPRGEGFEMSIIAIRSFSSYQQ